LLKKNRISFIELSKPVVEIVFYFFLSKCILFSLYGYAVYMKDIVILLQINECKRVMEIALKGMSYFQTYDRFFLG
jgi:hypothetical protein